MLDLMKIFQYNVGLEVFAWLLQAQRGSAVNAGIFFEGRFGLSSIFLMIFCIRLPVIS